MRFISIVAATLFAPLCAHAQLAPSSAFTPKTTGAGDNQKLFNLWNPTVLDIRGGSASTPLSAAGPAVKISRYEKIRAATCGGNPVDNECNAALHVAAKAAAGSDMQVNAITATAESVTNVAQRDAVALGGIGRVTGNSVSIGTGAYLEGRRDTSTARALGAEIRTTNATTSDCATYYAGIGRCDGLWITSAGVGSATALSSAVHIGATSSGLGVWREGVTVNSGAVSRYAFNDQSAATTSINIAGKHAHAILTAPGSGLNGFGTVTPAGFFDVDGGTADADAAGSAIYIRAQNAGVLSAKSSGEGGNIYLKPGAKAGQGANGSVEVRANGAAAATELKIKSPASGGSADVSLWDGDTHKWQFGKDSSNAWYLYDVARGSNVMSVRANAAMALMPASGDVLIGNPSGLATFSGHIASTGSEPGIACTGGKSPSISGTDTKGVITLGSGTQTDCTVIFSTAYSEAPVPVANFSAAGVYISVTSVTKKAVTFTLSSGQTSGKIYYHILQ